MSISAMKQALEALTYIYTETTEYEEKVMDEAIAVLEQAIAEAEKQEPVAWREVAGKTTQYYDYNEDGRGEPLYLHREWVGLTDAEMCECYNSQSIGYAIEAKLKEKNT
jgi:hypothetical protein